ncbi:MAG: V-type ATP synthase subunit F [Candidatus Latescibacterota bacterium]
MKIRIVGDSFTVDTFRLIGVQGVVAEDGEAAKARIEAYLGTDDLGMVLVSQTLADQLGEAFEHYMTRRSLPLVLSLPDRVTQGKGAEQLAALIESAIGIRF